MSAHEQQKNAFNRCHAVIDGMMDVNVPELELASDEERAERRPMRTAVYSIRKQLEFVTIPDQLDEYRSRIVDIIVSAADQIESLIDEDGE